MCSSCSSPSLSGRASPENIDTFWDCYLQHIQRQLDEQLPGITNPFPFDHPADMDIAASSPSPFSELEICMNELLQVHCSNGEVPLLFETASQPNYEELLEFSREPVTDLEDPFLLDRESAPNSDEPLDRFGLPVLFDNLLTMTTAINSKQEAVRRWLEYVMPLSPTSTSLSSPKPILDANLLSFLLSPTLVGTDSSPSNTSGDSESETSSTPSSDYDANQSGRDNYSEDAASNSYFGQPTHVTCHPHDDVSHGDTYYPYNCGSHRDFLGKNSRRFMCKCACSMSYVLPASHNPRNHSHFTGPAPPCLPEDHLESLNLAERGGVVTGFPSTGITNVLPHCTKR